MNLAIIGSGEMAKELYNLVLSCNEKDKYEKIFFVDLNENKQNNVISEQEFFTYNKKSNVILIAMGEPYMRKKMMKKYSEKGFELAKFIHPFAYVSNKSNIEDGAVILPFCYIAQDVEIGKNVLLHSGCKIENNCVIENNCFISVNSFVGARTKIKDTVFIGPGTVIRDNIIIGNNSIMGMGSVVTKSIENNSVCYGNPAVKIRENLTHKVF